MLRHVLLVIELDRATSCVLIHVDSRQEATRHARAERVARVRSRPTTSHTVELMTA